MYVRVTRPPAAFRAMAPPAVGPEELLIINPGPVPRPGGWPSPPERFVRRTVAGRPRIVFRAGTPPRAR
jgi:hypothetical protein